jgi:hypothetical protein
LANRARHNCLEDGSLPNIEDAAWVEDFYQEAGLRRESHRTPERIAEGIEDLWGDSRFTQPLKEVIEVAHDKAALIALESALDKLANYTNQLNPVISVFDKSIYLENRESEKIVLDLQNDLTEIENILDRKKNLVNDQWRNNIKSLREKHTLIFKKYMQMLGLIRQREDLNEILSTMTLVNKSTQILKKRLVDIA